MNDVTSYDPRTGPRESGRDGSRGARRTGSTPSPVTIL
jgi:hypothetical protein